MNLLLQSIRHAGLRFGICLLVPPLLAMSAGAQPLPGDPLPPLTGALSAQAPQDVPGRVARLADSSGQVWLFSPNSGPDSGEWINPPRNQPLTSGDRLVTDVGARAELRVGSTRLRLDGGSELEVTRLDDEHLALHLHAGSLAVRLRNADAAREFELTSDEGRFTALQPGRYRIDRNHAERRGGAAAVDSSTLTVYEGEAYYQGHQGPGSALTVYPNQRADFRLDAAGRAQYAITEALADAFARWSGERDRDDDRAASAAARYVSPEMTGIEDLDRNGRWEQDTEYGALWIPSAVAADWAPYSAGRWAWVRPWGWTWVDDAPWGFAPFHYGRWLRRGATWCWAPGRYVQRPVYAPALVVWLRGGAAADAGGRPDRPRDGRQPEPSIGWFPLGPREPFVPAYPHVAAAGARVRRRGRRPSRSRRPPRRPSAARCAGGRRLPQPPRPARADGAARIRAAAAPAGWCADRCLAQRRRRARRRPARRARRRTAWRPWWRWRRAARRPARSGACADADHRATGTAASGDAGEPAAAQPGRPPDGGRPGAVDAGPFGGARQAGGAGRDDFLRRPLPAAGLPQRPAAPLTQAAPPPAAAALPSAAGQGLPMAPAWTMPPAMPPMTPPMTPPTPLSPSPLPGRPVSESPRFATPTPPAAPLSPGRLPLPAERSVDARQADGMPQRGGEQRFDERPDGRRDDRRTEQRDDGRDERRDVSRDGSRSGAPWPRRDERRPSFPSGPAPALTAPGGPAPAVQAVPMPMQPAPRAPTPPSVAPPPTAAPAPPAPPAFVVPQRPSREAPARPPSPSVQPQPSMAPPAAAPREMPAGPRPPSPAEPAADALRRPLPVIRPSTEERRGPAPGNGPQRERER